MLHMYSYNVFVLFLVRRFVFIYKRPCIDQSVMLYVFCHRLNVAIYCLKVDVWLKGDSCPMTYIIHVRLTQIA